MNNQDSAARITGAFAHELCNPLQGVRSLIDVIGREAMPDSALNRKIERIEAGMERLAGIIQAFRATYENLPRAAELVSSTELALLIAHELEQRGATVSVHGGDVSSRVQAFAPELATLIAHAMLNDGMNQQQIELAATIEQDAYVLDCEYAGRRTDLSGITSFEDGEGLTGIPVLIDELTRRAGGTTTFRFDDYSLICIRLCLPTSR